MAKLTLSIGESDNTQRPFAVVIIVRRHLPSKTPAQRRAGLATIYATRIRAGLRAAFPREQTTRPTSPTLEGAVAADRVAVCVGSAEVVAACRQAREDWSEVMAMTIEERYAPLRLSFPVSLGRYVAALVAARQRQADERLADYLRGLPDGVIRKLGVSPADMEKLRCCGDRPPPNLYGRVSVVSVLRSARS
jgi:hypothetical protein